jgi:hypothetical protein
MIPVAESAKDSDGDGWAKDPTQARGIQPYHWSAVARLSQLEGGALENPNETGVSDRKVFTTG